MKELQLTAKKRTRFDLGNKVAYIDWGSHLQQYRDFIAWFDDGSDIVITLTDKRTLGKNAALHSWIRIIANEVGEDFDTIKYWMVIKHFGYTMKDIDGVETKIPVSTSKMSNAEFGIGLTRMYFWAQTELNTTLPTTDDMVAGIITKHTLTNEDEVP